MRLTYAFFAALGLDPGYFGKCSILGSPERRATDEQRPVKIAFAPATGDE